MKHSAIIYALILAFMAVSCTKEAQKTLYEKQEKLIENFVNAQLSANEEAEVVYNGGSVRVIVAAGDSEDTLSSDGTVSFYYAGYTLSGTAVSQSNLFATNREDIASGWDLSVEDAFEPVILKLDEASLVEGLRTGLKGVRTGEECYILFNSKHGYGDKAYGTIPAHAALVYRIWVNSIENN